MTKSAKPLPRFRTEAQERAFWETEGRDSTQHLDWAKAQRDVPYQSLIKVWLQEMVEG
jgi:hypothetical protein